MNLTFNTTYKIQVQKKGYKNYEQQIKIEENTPNIQNYFREGCKRNIYRFIKYRNGICTRRHFYHGLYR